MRIIAGQHRGHRLHANEGDTTRPITDRAKQSLFDALQDCFVDQRVMDCFSGSGSMGLECLSRGAATAIFIERDRGALTALRTNLDEMQMADRAVILPIDAYASAGGLHPEMHDLTIAFVDPPYVHMTSGHLRNKLDDLVRRLAAGAMVDGGIISLRHPTNVTIDPAALGGENRAGVEVRRHGHHLAHQIRTRSVSEGTKDVPHRKIPRPTNIPLPITNAPK